MPSPAISAARSAALRAACRLKPALQAVRATSALEFHAEVGAVLAGWGCVVRGAEHRACRSGDRRSKPARYPAAFRWIRGTG